MMHWPVWPVSRTRSRRIGRLGARLILQQALEDEATESLGRGRHERTEEAVSHRNGYEPRTVKTTAGSMRLQRPRVRNANSLGFESWVLGKGVARMHALESLVIGSFLRAYRRATSRRHSRKYPSAMAVIERDLDALVTRLRFPTGHRRRIRTTNLLERTFVEVRRRTKVIGRFPLPFPDSC